MQDQLAADLAYELTNLSHTHALLLQQYYAQAERWHLKLTASMGHLENQYVHSTHSSTVP